jgi:hypothetical protein
MLVWEGWTEAAFDYYPLDHEQEVERHEQGGAEGAGPRTDP